MSSTTNEFEHPGGNRPDNAEAEGAPTENRSDAGVGGAVYHESAADQAGVQSEPVLEQNTASTEDQLDGIAAQTRADLGADGQDRYEEVLRQRLSDAGIDLSDDEVSSLARRSAPGSGGGA